MANDQHNPEVPSDLEAEGIPDVDVAPPGLAAAGDTNEGMMAPRDEPVAVEDYGITGDEQQVPESLASRVEREVPDDVLSQIEADEERVGEVPTGGVGRIVDRGSGDIGEVDDEADAVATDVGVDMGGFSMEEAAMHITDEDLTDEPGSIELVDENGETVARQQAPMPPDDGKDPGGYVDDDRMAR